MNVATYKKFSAKRNIRLQTYRDRLEYEFEQETTISYFSVDEIDKIRH